MHPHAGERDSDNAGERAVEGDDGRNGEDQAEDLQWFHAAEDARRAVCRNALPAS